MPHSYTSVSRRAHHLSPLILEGICFTFVTEASEASPVFTTMLHFIAISLSLLSLASSISVIPGTGYLPAVVRAACRSALSENIAGCSDELQTPVQFIPSSSLNEICTSGCRNALTSMYSKAVTACGTGSVNVTSNTTSEILIPLNLAGELVFRYNATCLQDMFA